MCLGMLACSVKAPSALGSEPTRRSVPLGLDEFIPVPEDNPRTAEKIELGRQLFFDKRLSRDGTFACATCHIPERAFADGRRIAIGIDGRVGRRNVPTLFNRAYGRTLFWDGRASALEDQPFEAIFNPNEMGLTAEELGRRLKELNGLAPSDQKEGVASHSTPLRRVIHGQRLDDLNDPSQIAARNAANAIAAYVRSVLSGNSAFDRYEHGDASALSDAAKRGLQIFRGKGNCIACHSGPLLSDEDFHNTGVSWGKEPLDLGRFEITQREQDRGKFKSPTLRNLTLTAPYMHNGSLATLDEVVEFYNLGGAPNPNLDREIRPLRLSADEKRQLVEFLGCLLGTP